MGRNIPRTFVSLAFLAVSVAANGQFREVGPPPMAPDAARQRLRTLLQQIDANSQKQTISTISGLLVWYRDIFDEELIAAWQKDARANVQPVIHDLADARIATGIVEFSWRQARAATFTLSFAPMFAELMGRYPASARPMLDDLHGQAMDLSTSEAEAVCRILLDLPDTEVWQQEARQIFPKYPRAAERVLRQDSQDSDREKAYRADVWLSYLGVAGAASRPQRPSAPTTPSVTGPRRLRVDGARIGPPEDDVAQASAEPEQTTFVPRAEPPAVPARSLPALDAPVARPIAQYNGPSSGTLECRPVEIPQNGEYVFSDLPPGKLQLDYDTKIWDARLAPAGSGQKLILTNKRPGTQKRCNVRWRVAS
jgi:hypothetical protein